MKYYSVTKRNPFKSFLMRWMKLEHIIQSEVSQKERDKYDILVPWMEEPGGLPSMGLHRVGHD